MKRIWKYIGILACGSALAVLAYKLRFPEGIIYPTHQISAIMETPSGSIDGNVFCTKSPFVFFVHFPSSPVMFKWFIVDFEHKCAGVPNGPRHIVGGIYRPIGLVGVGLQDSGKIQELWSVTVDDQKSTFGNNMVTCRVMKTESSKGVNVTR